MILAGTGHRPDKLGGYKTEVLDNLDDLAEQELRNLRRDRGLEKVISGMALGWDTSLAFAAIRLRIPLICAIPFPQQPARWPTPAVVNWKKIKDAASEVVVIASSYSPRALQARNEWMVDRADLVLALWNGERSGGTWNCLRYAGEKGVPVQNCWEEWVLGQRSAGKKD